MNCPHCGKVVIVKLTKDDGKEMPRPASNGGNGLGDMLQAIDDSRLTGASVKFVEETRERYAKYKDNTKMSEKQLAWLRKLAYGEAEEEWS